LEFKALSRRWFLAGAGLVSIGLIIGGSSAHAQTATPSTNAPVLPPMPDASPRSGEPVTVVATTPILADIVKQIGGDRVVVESLLPANADPHDFEPKPADIVKLEDADLIVEHGLMLDEWAADLVISAGNEEVVVATDGVPTLPTNEEGFPSGDPHVWFDPTNVKIMASNIAAALSAFDPDGTASYLARLDAYIQQLDALDGWIAAQIATIPPERRKLVTNHDAFGYFVNRYGLTFVGSVIPSLDSRSEPSAKETADLIERIKSEGVPAIFTEAALNPELEEELAKQAGVTVVPNLYGDNLGEAGSGSDTYIGLMVTDTLLIVNALR
jgi:ABC-type Zn uptake system ZnuABC Zn-binding protein ZnuA